MWRIWRGMRSKPVLPSAAMAKQIGGNRPVVMQRVKFRRPRTNTRQVVFGGFVVFVCASVYIHVVLDPWDRFVQASLASLSREELLELKKKMDEPSFWPIPLSLYTVDSPPYKGNDPEWKMFVKINRDQELLKKIRGDLAAKVQQAVASHPFFSRQSWKTKQWWLNVEYPRAPPPVYHRRGLEGTRDGWSWTTKEVDRILAIRLQRTLWPEPLATSFLSLTTSLLKQNALSIAARFGYRPSEEKAPLKPGQPSTYQIQQSSKQPEAVKKEAGAMATAGQKTGAESSPTSGATPTATSGQSAGTGKEGLPRLPATVKDPKEVTAKEMVPFDATRAHLDEPIKKGLATYRQKWRPYRAFPPKGSILVSGLVELESAERFVIIDVQAWWDPVEKQFDRSSTHMAFRKQMPRHQYPAKD